MEHKGKVLTTEEVLENRSSKYKFIDMEENNKIVEFVREFNTYLEKTNQYCNLTYGNDGFTESVSFPQLIVFDDNNDSVEFVKQRSLSSLAKTLSEVNIAVGEMLSDELDKFFTQKKTEMGEKFTLAKMSYMRVANCRWKVVVSGKYNEDIMEQFCEVLEEDFKYIFEGLTLDIEW